MNLLSESEWKCSEVSETVTAAVFEWPAYPLFVFRAPDLHLKTERHCSVGCVTGKSVSQWVHVFACHVFEFLLLFMQTFNQWLHPALTCIMYWNLNSLCLPVSVVSETDRPVLSCAPLSVPPAAYQPPAASQNYHCEPTPEPVRQEVAAPPPSAGVRPLLFLHKLVKKIKSRNMFTPHNICY